MPRFDEEKLDASSLIIADEVESVPTSRLGYSQFVLGSYKVRPRVTREFTNRDKMRVFLQVYNAKTDTESGKNDISIEYRVLAEKKEIWKEEETSEQLRQTGEQVTIKKVIPLTALLPGKYIVEVKTADHISGEMVTRSEEFTVKQASGSSSHALEVKSPKN